MVFSIDTVLDSKNKVASTMVYEEVMEEKSAFDEAIEILTHENEMFNDIFNTTITESIVDRIKEFDFSTVLSKIFDLFVSALGRLANSFGAFLLNFVNKDAQLAAMKGKLANYRGNVRYTKPYYTYTNITPNTMTSVEYKRYIDDAYNLFTGYFSGGLSSVTDAKTLVEDMAERSEGLGDINSSKMNLLRGHLVGSNNEVPLSDFHDELFKYFRNGEVNKTQDKVKMFEKNIDGARIATAYNDYYASNKQIAAINRESFKFKAEAMGAKAKIRTFNPLGFIDKSIINTEVILAYNKFVSASCREIRNICDTFVYFFASKIDALKEYNVSNKEILLLACKQMVRDSGNND